MKILVLSLTMALLALFITGCQGVPHTRVLRVGMEDGRSRWLVSVNNTNPRPYASNRDLSNYIIQLRLQHGDLVIFKELPSVDQIEGFWVGLASYCASNQVALYLYSGRGEYSSSEFFSVPIYNWNAPFNNPRTLSAAVFFDEGRFLGVGKDGFEKMVHAIVKRKAHKILILGSLYNMDTQFGPLESPYEDQQDMLEQVLKENGIELMLLEPL